MKLQKNIGFWGRCGRSCLGILLLYLAYVEKSWVLLFFSLFTFFESLMSWCVVYQMLGINRCPTPKK
ncbi:MAG: DUF2892 domain-containing protein [Verrucomicrobia bacterium]|nr:DUF2892 domain-containing protein [Verrucomicrobiota bacterium]